MSGCVLSCPDLGAALQRRRCCARVCVCARVSCASFYRIGGVSLVDADFGRSLRLVALEHITYLLRSGGATFNNQERVCVCVTVFRARNVVLEL